MVCFSSGGDLKLPTLRADKRCECGSCFADGFTAGRNTSMMCHLSILASTYGIELYSVYFAGFNLLAQGNVEVDLVYGFTSGCQKFMMGLLFTLASSYGIELYHAYVACFNFLALSKLRVVV